MNDKSINSKLSDQTFDKDDLFCKDLPTQFQPTVGKILVTGATGYIGGRLAPELLARGYKVRVMIRETSLKYHRHWSGAEVVVSDALNANQLFTALKGIDTAYYLIHSLHLGPKKFAAADIEAAKNFQEVAEKMQVRRIIYLGGLGDIKSSLSSHLRSRAEVAKELKLGSVPVTILRAAVIVGSGSASYEIIKHLVKNLAVILTPPWASNRCQPIAVRDVIKYLVGALENSKTIGRSFDIGGDDILKYEELLKVLAAVIKKQVTFMPVRFSSIRFYAYVASLFTPVPNALTYCLLEGLKNEVICTNRDIKKLIPFKSLSYKEALIRAMSREEQDNIHTRWSDAYPPAHALAIKLHELERKPAYIKSYSLITKKESAALFASICKIGGREGWFHSNWLWRLRGRIDRVLLGVGLVRGRKSYSRLMVGDVIDFWRIEDMQKDKRLLLRAEMKLPGKAWLEFKIEEAKKKRKLSVTAYYDTHGFFGVIYWYICVPFHDLVFFNLIKEVEKRS